MTAPNRFRFLLSLTVAFSLAILAGFSGPGTHPEGSESAVSRASSSTTSSEAISPSWSVVATSGEVEVLPAGAPTDAWVPVGRGEALEARSLVRTGSRGRATLTRGGDFILMDADSELVLPQGSTGDVRIEQRSGSAVYDVEPRSPDRFEVATPYLVAGVKGTVFSVLVQDDSVAVNVAEGQVEVVSSAGGRADLFPGDMVLMEGPDGVLEIFRDGFDEFASSEGETGDVARRFQKKAWKLMAKSARKDPRNENPAAGMRARGFDMEDASLDGSESPGWQGSGHGNKTGWSNGGADGFDDLQDDKHDDKSHRAAKDKVKDKGDSN